MWRFWFQAAQLHALVGQARPLSAQAFLPQCSERVRWPEQVDGARNPKIQSIYLDKFPIHQAAFAAGGTHVVATSRRRHFYTFDLASASIEKVRSSRVLWHLGALIEGAMRARSYPS